MSETIQPIAARLTPAGRGAIAVIGGTLDGLPAFRPVNQRPWTEQPLSRLLYGQWGADPAEDVVVCRISPDRWEIHCHGGDAAVTRILQDLSDGGAHLVTATECHARFADALTVEMQAALSQAVTVRTADLLNEQCQGCLRDALTGLEADPPAWSSVRSHVERLLSWAEFGRHLTQPWQVVLTGRPNVGKSSLINALLGFQRAIVAEQPGTTRDVVTAVTAFDGWPVQLSDTAGLRAADSELEAAGIERARAALQSADLPVIVLDIGEAPTDTDRRLLADWPQALIVAHKADRSDAWGAELPPVAMRASSHSGQGIAELQRELVRRLVPAVPSPGTPLPVTERQVELLQQLAEAVATQDRSRFRSLTAALIGRSTEPKAPLHSPHPAPQDWRL